MSSQIIPAGELLARYLDRENSSEHPGDLMASLVLDYAAPAIRRVVSARLAQSHLREREDVESEAMAAVISRLTAMRASPAQRVQVDDFEAYAAGIGAHTVHSHIAAKFPERGRLRRRIRFALTSDPRLEIAESANGLWICGLSRHTARTPAHQGDLEACRQELAVRALPGRLPDFLVELFSRLGQPAELNALVSIAADLLGLKDQPSGAEPVDLPDPRPTPEAAASMRAWMSNLWREIRELSLTQRLALLLNLRTPSGSAIGLIGALGIATFQDLARTLEMTSEELHSIWNRLPFDDQEIAARLGLSRQQVINLRASARKRLGKRTSEQTVNKR